MPATVCRFRRGPFLELLDDCPALEKEILGRTTTELAAAQEQMLLLGRKTARERVASFLLGLGAGAGSARTSRSSCRWAGPTSPTIWASPSRRSAGR